MHEPSQLCESHRGPASPFFCKPLQELLERRIEERSRAVSGEGILPSAEEPGRSGNRQKRQASLQRATMLRYTAANRIDFG
jgi:hypothetical protein